MNFVLHIDLLTSVTLILEMKLDYYGNLVRNCIFRRGLFFFKYLSKDNCSNTYTEITERIVSIRNLYP